MCQQGCILSRGSRRQSVSCFSQLLVTVGIPWLVATISQFSRLRLRVFLCSAFALSFPLYVCVCQISLCPLFTIARTWKQPRCPLADKWIRNLWYIYTMDYYSAIKKNTFESILMRWMKLEPIIQSELSQKEKHQYSILMHIYRI